MKVHQCSVLSGCSADECSALLTFKASIPAWMTGTKTVSLSWESANMSGIWSRRLVTRWRERRQALISTVLSGNSSTVWILQVFPTVGLIRLRLTCWWQSATRGSWPGSRQAAGRTSQPCPTPPSSEAGPTHSSRCRSGGSCCRWRSPPWWTSSRHRLLWGSDSFVRSDLFIPLEANIYTSQPLCFN